MSQRDLRNKPCPGGAGIGAPPRRCMVAAALAFGLPAAAALPRSAAAHALVVGSSPAAGARLRAAPGQAVLRFNSRIDRERSRLTLIGPEDTPPAVLALDPGAEPNLLRAALPPLGPGAWRLRWQVLAVDGHITRGDIPFTVLPPP